MAPLVEGSGEGAREKRGREETGERGGNYATLRNILQSKERKEARVNKK